MRRFVTIGQLAVVGAVWASCGGKPTAKPTMDGSTIDAATPDATFGDGAAVDIVRRDAPVPPVPADCLTSDGDLGDALYGVFWERKQDELLDVTVLIGATSEEGAPMAVTAPGEPYEGARQICYDFDWPGGLFFYYPDGGSEPTRDLSRFDGGYLDLAIKSDADLFVGAAWRPPGANEETRAAVRASRYFRGAAVDGWQEVSIPLCALGAKLDHIKAPVSVSVSTVVGPDPVRVCVDAVRYREALACPATCAPPDGGPADGGTTLDAQDADANIDVGQDRPTFDPGPDPVPPECRLPTTDISSALYGVYWDQRQDELLGVTADIGVQQTSGQPRAFASTAPAYEGATQLCYEFDSPGALFIYYPDGSASPTHDLSEFADGYLDLALRTDAAAFIGLEWNEGGVANRAAVPAASYMKPVTVEGWREVTIPLCALRAQLDHVKAPVSVAIPTVPGPDPVRVCVDAVRYRKALACPASCAPLDAGPSDTGSSPDGHDAGPESTDAARDRPTYDPGPDPVPSECRSPTTDISRALYGVYWDQREDELFGVTAEIDAQQMGGQARAFTSAEPAYEGATQLCYELDSPGGLFIYYPDGSASPTHDLSAFADGYLDLALRTDATTAFIGIASGEGSAEKRVAVPAASYVKRMTPDGWQEISIPLCALPANLTQVKVPIAVNVTTVRGPDPVRLCVDAVRYRKGLLCPADCRAAPDAGQPRDASPDTGGEADAGAPPPGCPFPLVPAECGGQAASSDVYGLLLECKQDLLMKQVGGGDVGLYPTGTAVTILDQPTVPPYEGSGAVCTRLPQGLASSFVYILPAGSMKKTVNLSDYAGGYLEAAIASDVDVQVGMSWLAPGATTESRNSVSASSYVVGTKDSWREIRIPLCRIGANLAVLTAPATFTVSGVQTETTFCWDAVRLRKPLGTCRPCAAP
jgi:hypothetical protein